MKKILLLMSLLILVIGCSDKETEERIAMLEFRIQELETDLLCEDRNSGDALHSRFKVSRTEPKDFGGFCGEREKYLRKGIDYFPLSRYSKNYIEYQSLEWYMDEEKEELFESIYKDWYQEKE